jgi:hypothetical protein
MTTQFVTLDAAKKIAEQLGTIGGGVLPYKSDAAIENNPPDREDIDLSSGIYVPAYFAGPFPTPQAGDAKFYHFRFRNGADGFNAGLIAETMRFAPSRWPLMIALEVNAAGKR